MATRLYYGSNGVPPVSPTFDGGSAGWEVTGGAIRRTLEPFKHAQATVEQPSASSGALNTPAQAVDVLIAQYTSAPLDVDQTITGTVKGQVKTVESNSSADLRSQMAIWVRKADGTLRGLLLAHDTGVLSSEWVGSGNRNAKMPRGGAISLTSVAALATDRIVVELGFRKHENSTTARSGTLVIGNYDLTGSDLPENETDTSSATPWLEFSQDLTFDFTAIDARATQVALESLVRPDNGPVRATQTAIETLVRPDTASARVTQTVVEVLRASYGAGGSQVIIVG